MSLTEINAIDENYPVAGIDQSSQTFRDNFDNIKVALTDLDTSVITVIDGLSDVDTTTTPPVTDDVLVFDGVDWVPGVANIVLDVTPQLGADLDVNGFDLNDGANTLLGLAGVTLSVNWLTVTNAIATESPKLSAVGTDTDVDMLLSTKGTGSVIIDSGTTNSRIAAIVDSALELATEDNVAGNGPSITIFAGSSTGAGGNGGSINLRPGVEDGAGTVGSIFIRDQDNNSIARFRGTTSGVGVNFFAIRNATAGTPPAIDAIGADADINLSLNPKGTGSVRISDLNYPTADGTVGQVLKTSGTGFLSFSSPTDIAEHTTAGVPDPTTKANSYALLTDGPGGRTVVRSDGTVWKDIAVEGTAGTAGQVLTTDGTNLSFTSIADLGEFVIASLPTASTHANSYALATDAVGGRTIVRSDGTNWKIVAVEGATVT